MMEETPTDRFTVDHMPSPGDIDHSAATERANKMPLIADAGTDPKKVIGLAAAAGAVMFTVLTLWSGLTSKSTFAVTKPKPALEPAKYDPKTVIAPTLAESATDPNAPIQLKGPHVPPITALEGQAEQLQEPPQASPAQVLREAARRSSLIAYASGHDGNATQGYPMPNDTDDSELKPRGTEYNPTRLETLRGASVIGLAKAHAVPDLNFLLSAGSFIPCVLQTAMDSSQPGFVTCVIPRNVYSDNGRVVLMEKGTKIFGEYQSGINRGQYRLFVLWNRAVTPRGIAIDVASPATDALGRSGIGGRVTNFFWQRFGTALLFSLVEDAATVGVQAVGNRGANTTRVPSDAASTVLQQNAEIKPVLRKNQGEDVGITVAQDFDFSSVYGLAFKQ
jgi:type IV secretion system protein VirB10